MPTHVATPADWQAAAQLIGDAAGAESMDAIIDAVLRGGQDLFEAEIVIFDQLDRDMRQLAFQMYPAPTPELIRRAHPPFLTFLHQHPFQHDWVRTVGEGRVGLLSDRISGREFRRTDFWNEAFIHLRGKNQLMIGGAIDADRYWSFSFLRLGSDFGSRDRELGRFLQPHLGRVLQRQERRDRGTRAVATLDQAGAAYLLVDARGQLQEVSHHARVLLAKSHPASMKDLTHFATQSIGPGVRTGTLGNLQAVCFRPAAAASALIMLGDNTTGPKGAAARATPREAEILHWLGEGKTNPEIGLLLGVSPRTVEKHCEGLFAKLGVENRLAAALLARQRQ